VFVKDPFRGQSVAGGLLKLAGFKRTEPLVHTFRTADLSKLKRCVHRPGFARRKRAYDPALDGPLA
jgi:hypothetical protein